MDENPDGPVYEGDGIRFPIWPAAKYLIKVANKKPKEVLKIIERTNTENVRIYEDFVEAANNMPAKYAAGVVPFVSKWLDSPYMLVLWERLSKLLKKLAEEGEQNAALALADQLLDVKKNPKGAGKKIGFDKAVSVVRGDWEYQKILKDSFPSLIDSSEERAIFLLCDKLTKTIHIEDRAHLDDFRDLSSIWRGSIEKSNQNHPYGVKDALVSAIRDASYQLLKVRPEKLDFLVESLRKYPLPIFSRIGIHLTNEFSNNVTLPKVLILDEVLFNNIEVWHEYALLIQKWFPKLKKSDQNLLLSRIDSVVSRKNRKDSEEKDERSDRLSQFFYLTMLREHLSGNAKDRFEKYLKEFGELDHPTYHSYTSGGWVGPQSPKSKDDLKDLLLPEIARYLRNWKPKEKKFGHGPSVEGLGRELEAAAQERCIEFSENIELFKNVDRTYVRGIIRGISGGIDKNSRSEEFLKQVNWDNILRYCEWAGSQSDDSNNMTDDEDDCDSSWSWTRQEVARFLQTGFRSDTIPICKRSLAWDSLTACFEDKDPTLEREEKYLRDDDFYQMAINCTRGTALETLVMYGLWVVRGESIDDEERSFHHYPEIKSVLERHLNIKEEPSLAVRSIYGRWLPWLFFLDNDWTSNNLKNIFPDQPELEKYSDSAWLTYITFCNPYDDVFDKTRYYYERALEKAKGSSKENYSYRSPETRYVEHLMAFYWRGLIFLDDSLITGLFSELDLALRKTAITFIGRSLRRDEKKDDEIPSQVKKRLLSLLEGRFEVLRKREAPEDRMELAGFGWWFVTDQFGTKWSLEKMKETLELCGYIEPDHLVMDYLRDRGQSFPDLVMDCLKLIIKYATNRPGFYGWVYETEEILAQVLISKSSEAKREVEDLIHRLGAKGHQNFEKLLQEDPT